MSKYLYRQQTAGRCPSRAYHGAPRKPRTNRQYINPTRFIKAAKQTAAEPYQSKYNFNDFEIAQLIKHNVELRDWQTPTPIQDQTIPLALNGKDIVGIANTGTGKTLRMQSQ